MSLVGLLLGSTFPNRSSSLQMERKSCVRSFGIKINIHPALFLFTLASVCLYVCPFVYDFFCPYECINDCLYVVWVSEYLSICLHVFMCVCVCSESLSVSPSTIWVCMSFFIYECLFAYMSECLFVGLFECT